MQHKILLTYKLCIEEIILIRKVAGITKLSTLDSSFNSFFFLFLHNIFCTEYIEFNITFLKGKRL